MSIFALIPFREVCGEVPFFKLVVNGICPIDVFWSEIEMQGNLNGQLINAMAIMDRVAQGLPLPRNKYKNITSSKDPFNLFEVKTRDLRIYLFRKSNGAIVVLGGKKSSQRSDIKRFRNLVYKFQSSML